MNHFSHTYEKMIPELRALADAGEGDAFIWVRRIDEPQEAYKHILAWYRDPKDEGDGRCLYKYDPEKILVKYALSEMIAFMNYDPIGEGTQ